MPSNATATKSLALSKRTLDLVNALIDSEEQHGINLEEDGEFWNSYGVRVSEYSEGYVISWKDCSHCDGSHVDCTEMEETTNDADEAIEMVMNAPRD